jgi:hypothetical protein
MPWAGALFPWTYLSSIGVLEARWKHLILAGFWDGKQRRGRREKLRLEGPLRGSKSIKDDSRLRRHDFENLGQETALTAIAGLPQSPWLRSTIGSRRQASGPPSAGPPQPRESRPAAVTFPSHPGGGKAEPITRVQGCGVASSRTQRQPRPTATKRRRTCEALAPRETIKIRRWVRTAPTSGTSRIGLDQPMHC